MPPLPGSPHSPPRRLLQAAADGNIPVLESVAHTMAIMSGRGSLREAVESVRDCGAGALHVAAGNGQVLVCMYLVGELGVDVNPFDESGDTPLAYAVRSGSLPTVQYLLNNGAIPDKTDNKGCTPLHLAAARGYYEIVRALLLKGANVDALWVVGTKAQLHQSIYCKLQEGTVKDLWNHLAADYNRVTNIVQTPLTIAIEAGSLASAELLIKAGANVNGVGTAAPALITAAGSRSAASRSTDFYKCLLEAGADPNARDDFGHLPIEIAAYNNRWKDVEILLPVTTPVPYVHDWSIDGVANYAKSVPQEVEDYIIYRLQPTDLKSSGAKAYSRQEYIAAIKFYSMAMLHFPNDETLYSNRGLCWLKMGKGDLAFRDAQTCRTMRPNWGKACYLQGRALMLLKNYGEACHAFVDALIWDPANDEIHTALRNAANSLKEAARTAM